MISPYPWLGGKFYEKKWIIPLIPVHDYYYEAFFGSGIILLNKPKSEEEFANDLNSRMIAFWLCIQDEELMKKLKEKCFKSLDSRFVYQLEMYKAKKPEELNLVDQAFNFIYLIKYGFNAFPNTYYTPLTHQMFKIKNFSRTFRLTTKKLPKYYDRIKDVRFTNYDFKEFLQKNVPSDGKFIFLDPPYYQTHGYRDYGISGEFTDEEYKKMRELLEWHTDGGSYWMITCNQTNPFFNGMKNSVIKLIDRRTCINKNEERRDVKTKVIMNYKIEDVGSMEDKIHFNKNEVGDGILV